MSDDDAARERRAEELREEIERLRSGEEAEKEPRSPRDFTEEAAREEADLPDED